MEARRCREVLSRIYADRLVRARTARERLVLRWLLEGLEEDLEIICGGFEGGDLRILTASARR